MAITAPQTSQVFKVHRREPELITPSKPTPHDFKYLSEIDAQTGLQFQIPVIQFYQNSPTMQGKDPVKIIRAAIAKTLVFYYPFAGRLREGPSAKLMVECTGEGIWFIEADADVSLEQFGDALQPPFPCVEELLFDVPGTSGILHCPLLLVQITRLRCGGFIFAIRLNHTMSDGPGLVQFMSAVSEMARGSYCPYVLPVWERHILSARDPPQVTHQHREYYQVEVAATTCDDHQEMSGHDRSFFFGPREMSALRNLVHPNVKYSTSEIITACVWKCRTIALQLDPVEEVSVMCIVNARHKFSPPIPKGYYGNAFAFPAAVTTAGNLSRNPLGYALDLLRKAKAEVTEEYMQSVAALMAIKGRYLSRPPRSYIVSDIRYVGFQDVDFGWGKPLYAGVAKAGAGDFAGVTYFMSFRNNKGEKGTVVPLRLPPLAMEIFAKELEIMLMNNQPTSCGDIASKFIKSSL